MGTWWCGRVTAVANSSQGLCMMCMGLVHNYSGLLAARWFLGITEAGLFRKSETDRCVRKMHVLTSHSRRKLLLVMLVQTLGTWPKTCGFLRQCCSGRVLRWTARRCHSEHGRTRWQSWLGMACLPSMATLTDMLTCHQDLYHRRSRYNGRRCFLLVDDLRLGESRSMRYLTAPS